MKLPSEISKTLYDEHLVNESMFFINLNTINWLDAGVQYVELKSNGVRVFETPNKYKGRYGVLFTGVIIETNIHFAKFEPPKLAIVVRTATSGDLLFFTPRSKDLVLSIFDFIDDNYLVSYQDLSDFIDAQTIMHSI